MSRRVSVLFPAYGRSELLRGVIDSVLNQDYGAVELVITVNDPDPRIREILESYEDRIRVLWNDRNVGFAEGMNQAASAASGDYLYLSANDIVLAPDYLRVLVETAEQSEGWGLLGGVWYDYDQPDRVHHAWSGARFSPSLRIEFHRDLPTSDQPFDADWLPGAAIFTTREAWRALDGFRGDFFAHCEDIDLCIRARKAGGFIRVVPSARLYHHGHPNGMSSSHLVEYYKLRNYAAVNTLYAPVWSLPWLMLKNTLYSAPRIAFHLKSPGFYFRAMGGIWKATPAWLRERFVQRPRPPVIPSASVPSRLGQGAS